MTTVEEARAIIERYDKIENLKGQVSVLSKKLAAVTKNFKAQGYQYANLLIERGDQYGNGNITHEFKIPIGVIQQSLVDDIADLSRQIVKLGGI